MNKWLIDVNSRGQLAFNKGTVKTLVDAITYATRRYELNSERIEFVIGWKKAALSR